MMVGSILSYWEGNFSGSMLNFGRVTWWSARINFLFFFPLCVCVHPIWPFGKSWAFVSPPWADVCHFLWSGWWAQFQCWHVALRHPLLCPPKTWYLWGDAVEVGTWGQGRQYLPTRKNLTWNPKNGVVSGLVFWWFFQLLIWVDFFRFLFRGLEKRGPGFGWNLLPHAVLLSSPSPPQNSSWIFF